MAQPVEIEIKAKGLAELKTELRGLKSELANATDPADIERLSMAAGELSDKISDVNEKVKIFAAGSDFEKVSNGLGLIGNQLANLDFEGASESAKLLTATIKNMDPKAVADGFKNMISTVGQLGNAFVQMGLKLLANPLFLLVAIIGGIVAAIVMLKDKLKIAETAFNMMAAPIKVLIQLMKDLTDWIGITSFAEEEAAAKSLKAAEKRAAASKKLQGDLEADFDRRIALAKAEGKDTSALEIEKTKTVQTESAKRVAAYNREIEAQRGLLKNQTEEQQKETKAKIDELRKNRDEDLKINRDAENNVKVIKAQTAREAAEEAQKQREKDLDNQKRINEKRLAEEKRLREEQLALIRAAADKAQELESKSYQNILEAKKGNTDALKTERQRELDDAVTNYTQQIELASQFGQSTTELEAAKTRVLKEINDRYDAQDKEKRIANYQEEQADALKKADDEALSFEERYAIIDAREKALIENKDLSEKEKTAIEEQNAEARKRIGDAEFAAKQTMLGAISQLASIAADELGQSTAAGKALAVAAATIDTYAAIAGQLRAFSKVPVPGYAIAQAIATGAMGLVQVKKILSTKVPGKSGGTGGSLPTMSNGTSASATPNVQLVGAASRFNETQQGETRVANQQMQQNITVTAVVSETEITSAQGRVANIQRGAEL